uniref:Phytotoxin PcF domain-containing protein n=1 Tax=Phytophthora ramorum TaxID=164328 RepID=H3G5T2_PHYRM
MNFKTCFAVALAAIVATSVSAQPPQYCVPTEENGCPSLYTEASIDVSKTCRDIIAVKGGDFLRCCESTCGKVT